MFHDELASKWGLSRGGAVAPIWVGEFGNGYADDYWIYMMRFIEEYQLDWAYWAINGDKWLEDEQAYAGTRRGYRRR